MKKTFKQKILGYSGWFRQDKGSLIYYRAVVAEVLSHLGRSEEDIQDYLIAYDYFIENPTEYDGSTFVRDLYILRIDKRDQFGQKLALSIDSVKHDYDSIHGGNTNYIKWIKDAWVYRKNLRKNGKGTHLGRFIGLLIIGIPFVIYKAFLKNINQSTNIL